MASASTTKPARDRSTSPMQLEKDEQTSTKRAQATVSSATMADATRLDIESAPLGSKKPRKKTGKSRNARAEVAVARDVLVDVVEAVDDGEPAYRLPRVQKIVKMNDQALISKEAAFVMALAAEEMTRRLTRAGCDVAKTEQRLDLALSDVATAVLASTSLSFLADIIPQTMPLSTARSRRLTKDITPFPPDPTQTMVSRIQDTLRHNPRSLSSYAPHKLGNPGGIGTPVAVMLAPSPPGATTSTTTAAGAGGTSRNYSPREAKAIANANAKAGSQATNNNNNNNGRSVPIGAMMPPPMTLPPGFDYRTLGLPPPPPGMTFHAIDPEAYKNGIRWAPVQARDVPAVAAAGAAAAGLPGGDGEGSMPPGPWIDPNGNYIVPVPSGTTIVGSPHLFPTLPPPPAPASGSTPAPAPSASTSTAPARSSRRTSTAKSATTRQQQQAQSNPAPAEASSSSSPPVVAASGSGTAPSPFHPGQLHGRTIYSADVGNAEVDSAAAISTATAPPPKTNGRGGATTGSAKKRASTKGRASLQTKKARGEEDAMDVTP